MGKINIIIAAAVLGACFIWGITLATNSSCSVDVRGLSEREVKADRGIYPIIIAENGNDLNSLYVALEQKTQDVCAFIKEQGFDESECNIAAPTITDNYANSYTKDAHYRYNAKRTITIYTQKIDSLLSMSSNLSQLLAKGIVVSSSEYSWENNVKYLFEGLNDIKPDMIKEATANARVAAEEFAKNSGSHVGKIQHASQGYFTIEDRDDNTPYIKKVRVVTEVTFKIR